MRILAIMLLVSISSLALADEPSKDKPVSYYIAPGVLVTSFYNDADKAAESAKAAQPAATHSSQSSYGVAPSTMSVDYPSYWRQAASTTPMLTPTRYYDTPNRFYMQQNGKTMTADDFDRWVKERGLKISGGKVVQVE
jgi:hypothetical protein